VSGGISVREAIKSVVRVIRRDGFLGLAKRTRVHLADARECRHFLRSIRRNQPAGPEQIVETAFSSQAVRRFQIKSEILGLAQRVSALRPRTLLEIGTAEGGTLFVLSQCAAPDATFISLDLPGGGYPA